MSHVVSDVLIVMSDKAEVTCVRSVVVVLADVVRGTYSSRGGCSGWASLFVVS